MLTKLPFVLLLSVSGAFAQSRGISGVPQPAGSAEIMKINNFMTLAGRNGIPLFGSPYADNRWLPAHLTTVANVALPSVPLKYDVLNQRLLMRPLERPNDSLQLDDSQLVSFALDLPGAPGTPSTATKIFRRFSESPVPTQRAEYVEVLHQGAYTLLKRYVKTVRKATPHTSFDTSPMRDEILDKPTYYLCLPGGGVIGGAVHLNKLNLKALQEAAPQLGTALAAVPGAATAATEAEWATALAAADPRR